MKTLITNPLLKEISVEWLKEFSNNRKEPSWLLELRLKAFDQYTQLPWPTQRDERWKRTELNLLNWEKLVFTPTEPDFFKNDSTGSEWITLEEAISQKPKEIETEWTSALAKAASNKFFSLTLALGNGGMCLFAPKNKKFDASHLDLQSKGGLHTARFPLSFVIAEEGSEVQVWQELSPNETDTSPQAENFVSSFFSIHLKDNVQASLFHIQHWDDKTIHFHFEDIVQEANSKLSAVTVEVGGRVFRNESTIHLNGVSAENKVLGVLFGGQSQNFENWVTQNHNAPKTTSDIQYRGALKGSAKSFFSGLVSIVKKAQQSDAYQAAKYLLLSKDARADAIPNLEILADDVKCSHGAAVGPVDEDQKFYLQTRGVPPDLAEKIIIEGFFEPVIAAIPSESVQERLRNFIEEKLAK